MSTVCLILEPCIISLSHALSVNLGKNLKTFFRTKQAALHLVTLARGNGEMVCQIYPSVGKLSYQKDHFKGLKRLNKIDVH